MTVKELIEHLKTFDENLEVIYRECSAWSQMRADLITKEKGVDKAYYIMRSHRTMVDKDKHTEKEYIGDGVYIQPTDFGDYLLTTENGIEVTNSIWLEHRMFDLLIQYRDRINQENK